MKRYRIILLFIFALFVFACDPGRTDHPDTGIPGEVAAMSLRYHPEGEDFVIINGNRRFNRAIYGTHTAFRIEAGDLPEFALYLPGMGGNMKFGLSGSDTTLWLVDADQIKASYRPGSMLYEIKDPLLGKGILFLQVLALAGEEGLILKFRCDHPPEDLDLVWVYGGASGKRFSREGDIGADPESSFYLDPEYCAGNRFETEGNAFTLTFTSVRNGDTLRMYGLVPPGEGPVIRDANMQVSPASLMRSGASGKPVIAGSAGLDETGDLFFIISAEHERLPEAYKNAVREFEKAGQAREAIANRIKISTPDPFINTFGGALAIAADAIWEEPSYLHGAVAWRMRLPGWRGAYVADWLGWHGRTRQHFRGYALAQYTEPPEGPVAPDPATHLTRQEEVAGKSIFTRGYISRRPGGLSRPHHYDMNLVFMDQLLWHLEWTGDLDFAREMWPVIVRHLEWEKRCFDGDDDGLYDAYACIWASDALQYSGGGVTHSSAYNYRANLIAAEIAEKLGEDPDPFRQEAERIATAVQEELWIPGKGWYGEYRDLLGLQRVHPSAAVWTIYHALDGGLPDPFQAWQSLRYVDHHIPHIPMVIGELPGEACYSLSTTCWMPYEWSINNVALAENLNMALAYWQGGDPESAFRLWKSQILGSMYLGASPGNFNQLSFLDVFRGELYRDFADPIGIAARTLVEGLFGIRPCLLEGTLEIDPGFPEEWDHASLETPDISFAFSRKGKKESYKICHSLPGEPRVIVKVPARGTAVRSVRVNGQDAEWQSVASSVGGPEIELFCFPAASLDIEIMWEGDHPERPEIPDWCGRGEALHLDVGGAAICDVYDPQEVLTGVEYQGSSLGADVRGEAGYRTFFVKVVQGGLSWWVPADLEIREPLEILPAREQAADGLKFRVRNNTGTAMEGEVTVQAGDQLLEVPFSVDAGTTTNEILIRDPYLLPGNNPVTARAGSYETRQSVVNWKLQAQPGLDWDFISMDGRFNDLVTNIFSNEYLSPRCSYPTLQIPVQGIGDWCSYAKTARIDDSGIRERAGTDDTIELRQGIPVRTPGDPGVPNILFTSLWDNYPDRAIIPLTGKAVHAYLLMAGSTHHMQSRIANGRVTVEYADGSKDKLELVNPDTWWPVEQDYYTDDHAFFMEENRPPRIHLLTGIQPEETYDVLNTNKTNLIDGGAATLLDLPLDPGKKLKSLHLETLSNDVVIGLMGVTLLRPQLP